MQFRIGVCHAKTMGLSAMLFNISGVNTSLRKSDKDISAFNGFFQRIYIFGRGKFFLLFRKIFTVCPNDSFTVNIIIFSSRAPKALYNLAQEIAAAPDHDNNRNLFNFFHPILKHLIMLLQNDCGSVLIVVHHGNINSSFNLRSISNASGALMSSSLFRQMSEQYF